jgi:hypothetical protein
MDASDRLPYVFSSTDSSGSSLNKELRQAQQARQGQRHSGRRKVSDPGASVIEAVADSPIRKHSL